MEWIGPRERRRPAVGDLVAECDAFLVGEYLELLDELDQLVPSNAWINPLAHADAERLAELARGQWDRCPLGYRPWERAVVFLAGEVLDASRRWGCEPADVQRAVLIPLELDLLRRTDGVPVESGQLVALVLVQLHGRPSAPSR
jgi:hypothetical protein